MDPDGCAQVLMVVHGYLWLCMGTDGCVWIDTNDCI